MVRLARKTENPEMVALGVLALRTYANGIAAKTDFEVETTKTLKNLGVSKTTAKNLVANFDKINPKIRRRVFGPFGLSTAKVPANIVKASKALNPLSHQVILRPGALAQEFTSRVFDKPKLGDQQVAEVPVPAARRYTINYQGMHCVDETGFDKFGSDEIYIITSAVHITKDGTNAVRTERHPLNGSGAGTYGDVDSHETRIDPVAASRSAKVDETTQGMSLTTIVMEHDLGDPDAYRDEVDASVKLAIAIASYFFPPGGALLALVEASGLVTDLLNSILGTGDDEIGTVTSVHSLEELETLSRTRLSSLHVSQGGKLVDTGLKNHFLAPVNNNDYIVGLRVNREPNAPLLPGKHID